MIFTIPADLSAVDALAEGILTQAGTEPLALARMTVLLPTQRACRSLREAFLRRTGGHPLLLPRLRPLGDMDEDELSLREEMVDDLSLPPAVPLLRRQLLLAKLILAMGAGRGGRGPTPEQAAQLAEELGRLLDQVQIEGLGFERLHQLVPAEYAAHWQITLDFLKLLTEHWPDILLGQGYLDAAERRRRLLLDQAALWRREPPADPVIAAGSTGSNPAVAELLAVVARLPQGAVVLPGLDRDMDDASWQALEPTHPQFGMKQLLDTLEVERRDVRLWQRRPGPRSSRVRLIAEALRPATTTDAWRLAEDIGADALDGVTRLDCPGPREEAGAIALLLREALETDGRTAALITPDRSLARRVAAELGRWGIAADDSGGRPLALTMPGVFLRLVAEMVSERFAPHAALAAVKHPLAAGGMASGTFRAQVRRLELAALRGPRPAAGVIGLRDAAKRKHFDAELDAWLRDLDDDAATFADLLGRPSVSLADLVNAHIHFAERLAADDTKPGAQRLWAGDAGEIAAHFISDLTEAADTLGNIPGSAYAGLFETLMSGSVVRPRWGGHPRLHILGPLEARLQHMDLVVLGGLNEGTWPPQSGADPWMSRPMRAAFGLPLPERRVGLSAHDFAQAFCAPEVVLTRAARVDGTPTVPSRWLMRLDAVLQACALPSPGTGPHAGWFTRLDKPDHLAPGKPPAPCPPVEDRPRRLSATEIETWMRDPYAIYARHVLRLKALDGIDEPPDAAQYGEIIHKALEKFLKTYPAALPADAENKLLVLGREVFGDDLATPGVWAFWWPRFERIAHWFVQQDRSGIQTSICEVEGHVMLDGPAGPFKLVAKADRIDLLRDGTLSVIDYKTGAPPTGHEVAVGYAPQLPIEALIAQGGGFPGVPAKPVSDRQYWRLRGGERAGEIYNAAKEKPPAALADEALAGVQRLIAVFDLPDTKYQARPHPERAPRFSDYLHLARVKEWASLGGEEE